MPEGLTVTPVFRAAVPLTSAADYGPYTAAWASGWDFGAAGAPTLSATANARDIIIARLRNGKWRAAAGLGYSS